MNPETFFLNAAAAALLGTTLLAWAVYAWDTNRLPHTWQRTTLIAVAAVFHYLTAINWMIASYNDGDFPSQLSWIGHTGWIGRTLIGVSLLWWIHLERSYRRQRRAEHAELEGQLNLLRGGQSDASAAAVL